MNVHDLLKKADEREFIDQVTDRALLHLSMEMQLEGEDWRDDDERENARAAIMLGAAFMTVSLARLVNEEES